MRQQAARFRPRRLPLPRILEQRRPAEVPNSLRRAPANSRGRARRPDRPDPLRHHSGHPRSCSIAPTTPRADPRASPGKARCRQDGVSTPSSAVEGMFHVKHGPLEACVFTTTAYSRPRDTARDSRTTSAPCGHVSRATAIRAGIGPSPRPPDCLGPSVQPLPPDGWGPPDCLGPSGQPRPHDGWSIFLPPRERIDAHLNLVRWNVTAVDEQSLARRRSPPSGGGDPASTPPIVRGRAVLTGRSPARARMLRQIRDTRDAPPGDDSSIPQADAPLSRLRLTEP